MKTKLNGEIALKGLDVEQKFLKRYISMAIRKWLTENDCFPIEENFYSVVMQRRGRNSIECKIEICTNFCVFESVAKSKDAETSFRDALANLRISGRDPYMPYIGSKFESTTLGV